MNCTLTAERLRTLLTYDPETGDFTWKVRRGCSAIPGARTGKNNGKGYLQIRVDGRNYAAHRLAWFYVTGEWPKGEIDHIDGKRARNAFANLRDVDRSTNCQNLRAARSGSATGLLGASRSRNRFQAQIGVAGKNIYLGRYDSPEEAQAAYRAAKQKLHPGSTTTPTAD